MDDGWTLIRWLHLLAMAAFVGGQLMLAAVVVPSLRGEQNRGRLRLVARRFGWLTLGAIGVLLATGIVLAGEFDRWSDGTLHAKLGLVGVVTLLILWHIQAPARRELDGLIFVGSLAIVWLGVMLAH